MPTVFGASGNSSLALVLLSPDASLVPLDLSPFTLLVSPLGSHHAADYKYPFLSSYSPPIADLPNFVEETLRLLAMLVEDDMVVTLAGTR